MKTFPGSPIVELAGRAVSCYARFNLRMTQSFVRAVVGFPVREWPQRGSGSLEQSANVANLVHLFHSAVGREQSRTLISLLNSISQNGPQIQRAFIAWLDLVEVLVQEAENDYQVSPGKGKLKKEQVKSALRYLSRTRKLGGSKLVGSLPPVAIDLLIDWSIDQIVLLTNQYDLWVQESLPATPAQRFRDALRRVISFVGSTLARFLGRLAEWFDEFSPEPVLSPKLEAALKAVEQEGLISGEENLVRGVVQLVIQLGSSKQEIILASEVIFAAVQEAETYLSLSGPGKKEYARNLINAVLEESGFSTRSQLLSAFIDVGIDLLIETSVHLFHKRGVFPPHLTETHVRVLGAA
jgi:hypothetical protein